MRSTPLARDRAGRVPHPPPAWARAPVPEAPVTDAAFAAGAVFAALDAMQRSDAAGLRVWRQRLALAAAQNICRLLNRRVDAHDLRDAWLLRRPDIDPGPEGRVFGCLAQAARRPPRVVAGDLDAVAAAFGLGQGTVTAMEPIVDAPSDEPPLTRALSLAARLVHASPRSEPLAMWCADQRLAQNLGWPTALPLFALMLFTPVLRAGEDGRRVRPDDPDWPRRATLGLVHAGTQALSLAADLMVRAERLDAAVPKLRAKGASAVVDALLQQDALSTSTPIHGMSERGLRRLFERLVALGAVRELSGRPTFRLYGL